jgi:hypothetical protein
MQLYLMLMDREKMFSSERDGYIREARTMRLYYE